jgi:CBS domain-containing protein
MAEKDIGSLVVMEHGDLVGMLTFREVIQTVVKQRRQCGQPRGAQGHGRPPLTCTAETELDEVRRMMLDRHARYMPVMDKKMLMGVISFYDVAKAVVDSQNFENKMLKAYIRDWPAESRRKKRPSGPCLHRREASSAHAGVDHLPHPRVDLLVPLAAAEHAVVAHAHLDMVGFQVRAGCRCTGPARPPSGRRCRCRRVRPPPSAALCGGWRPG